VAEVQWFFPSELDEVPDILAREGVIPHGGGTGILWSGLTRVRGLMDVSGLDLKYIRRRDGSIALGAALSYSETVRAVADTHHPLAHSLHSAAAQPLRNRITLGGSISMFPYWSDLMGPLLALEAKLSLAGANGETRGLEEYLQDRNLRTNTLITSVLLPDVPWQGAYYRHTRTPTDRPAFSITVALRLESGKIETIRVVVVGCTGRYRRLTEIEAALTGTDVPSKMPEDLSQRIGETVKRLGIDFPARMGFGAEYLNACAEVELVRTVASAIRSAS